MPKFRVFITQDVTATGHIDIEADSIEEANDQAWNLYLEGESGIRFELDECSNGETYISDTVDVSEA